MTASHALRRAVQRLRETEHCDVCRRDVPSHAYRMNALWCDSCAAIVPRITQDMAGLARVSAPW